jgi:hypothetical protein
MIHKLVPWLVLAAVLYLLGVVIWDYAHRPVTVFELFILLGMTGSGAVVVWGYFRMYAIFERMIGK